MPSGFFSALRDAASSPLALIAYALLLASWTYVSVARHRLKRIASVIDKVPANQRAELLAREFSTFPRSGLSAEQWLRSQRQRLVFLAVLALLVVAALLAAIAMVERSHRSDVIPKPVDWQMSLIMGALGAFDGDRQLWLLECPATNPPASFHLPHDSTIKVAARIGMVVDNVYRTHRGLIYPIGFSTTWDRTVHVVYDGLDVDAERARRTATFTRDFSYEVTLKTPKSSGPQYLVFLAGAALDAHQLFTFRADAQTTSQSFWDLPHTSLADRRCVGYLKHPFVRNDGLVENATFPILAVPIEID